MIELVMLDADGVLFESDESNIAYYNEIFRILGEPPLSADEERLAVFLSTRQVFELRAGADPQLRRRMGELAARLDFAPFYRLLRPPFELRPFLCELGRRYKLGLATNRSTTVPGLIQHLDLDGVFSAVACVQEQVQPKPAPDILHLCLARAGIAAERAVYVGDSPIDREAAAAAGVAFIGVGARVIADNLIERLHDLPAALAQMSHGG
jgi:phosphoglycolate phosphatase